MKKDEDTWSLKEKWNEFEWSEEMKQYTAEGRVGQEEDKMAMRACWL